MNKKLSLQTVAFALSIRKPVRMLLTLSLLAIFSLPSFTQTPGDYNPGDIAVVNNIIDTNGLSWTKAVPADGSMVPADWTGVAWDGAATDQRIMSLDISSKSLSGALDVSGLTALTSLSCSNNSLATLDVANLTGLAFLYCDNTNLTTLDLTNLTALQVLFCRSNSLTTLDLTNLTALQALYCRGNSLATLDVSNLTSLTSLECSLNYLTTLDVTGLTLSMLNVSENYMTSKTDVIGFPAASWDNINYIYDLQYSGSPLYFEHKAEFDIPAGLTGTAITTIDVSTGVSGGSGSYSYYLYPSPTSSWLSIDSDGKITGTRPSTAKSQGYADIQVYDNVNYSQRWINIAIGAVTDPVPPVITTPAGALSSGATGSAYSVTLAATNTPTSWVIASGALPNGLTLNTTTGVISGTPSATGTFNFSVTATNSDGTSPAVAFSITINTGTVTPPSVTAPHIIGPFSLKLTVGYAATSTDVFTITGSGPVTVTKTAGDANITWNNATKKLDIAEGLTDGIYPVKLSATNSGGTFFFTFTLTVEEKVYYLDIPSKFPGGTVVSNTSSNPYLAIAGQTVTLTITPDKGYVLESITVYNTDTNTPIALSGTGLTRTFIMPAGNISVVAVFQLATGINAIETTGLKGYVAEGTLHVSGLTVGKIWHVYNLLGVAVYQGVASDGKAEVLLPGRGVYLIVNDKTSIKVVN